MPTVTQQIPAGWEVIPFEDCLLPGNKKLKGLRRKDYKNMGAYPIIDQGNSFVSGYTDAEDMVYEPESPMILFGDHTRILKYIDFPFAIGADGTKIFQTLPSIEPKFFYYYLLNTKIPNTGYNRHYKYLKDLNIGLPPLPEQTKIANILSKVDSEIEKVERIIEQTEKLKKGLMQKLLTKGIGHTKFKQTELGEIPEEWEVKTLKESDIEIIDGDRGENYPKKIEFMGEGYCLFLSNKNIKNDKFVFDDCAFITEEKDNLLRKGKLKRFDVVLTTRGTVGNVGFFDKTVPFENIRLNSGMLIFRAENDFAPEFLYALFKSPLMKMKYKSVASGSAQPQLPIRSLEQIKIPLPPKDEQKKIAKILESSDQLLYKTKKQKKSLKKLKKGLMSDLLSGKVRVSNS